MQEGTTTRNAYMVLNVRPDAHQAVIRAAFHALAAIYHPDVDSSPEAGQRMAELNIAYGEIRTPEARSGYNSRPAAPVAEPVMAGMAAGAKPSQAVPPPHARRAGRPGSATIDFGRYDGWTLAELAGHDPDYLRWLNRHTSGVRYRREIDELLAAAAGASRAKAPKAPPRGRWARFGI